MSAEGLSSALALTLSPPLKILAISLGLYAGPDRCCTVSQKALSKDTSMTEKTVRGWLHRLEEMGLIERVHRYNGSGGRENDEMRLNFIEAAIPVESTVTPRSELPVTPDPIPVDVTGSPRVEKDSSQLKQEAGSLNETPSLPGIASEPPPPPKGSPSPPDTDIDGLFARFWEACVKKVGKGASRRAFVRAVTTGKGKAEDIIAAMERLSAACRENDTEHKVCHPATWLNGERWTDEDLPFYAQPQDENGNPIAPLTKEERFYADRTLAQLKAKDRQREAARRSSG